MSAVSTPFPEDGPDRDPGTGTDSPAADAAPQAPAQRPLFGGDPLFGPSPTGAGSAPVFKPVTGDTPPPPPVPRSTALDKIYRPESESHRAIAAEKGWYFIDLDDPDFVVDTEASDLMKAQTARNFNAIPVAIEGRKVLVAVDDPADVTKSEELRPFLTGYTMRLGYANPHAIRRYIERVYSASGEAAAIARSEEARRRAAAAASEDGGDLGRVQSGQESSVAQMLRLTIEQALRENASDIHFEPTEFDLDTRIRVDGHLRSINRYPKSMARTLMTKIKVDAGMRSDNFLVPDSGVLRYTPRGGGAVVDIRVEISPTAWGAGAVMRLQQNIWRELSGIGFSGHNEPRIRRALAQPNGILLATGPTGSGKSTLMYSLVRERIRPETKIITLENPVEYKVPEGVEQLAVNFEQGMTFATGLRSILRRDPDVVLVGEIRDTETAETAVDAAMTGHLVLSTLHTNDAPGVVPRLLRMGIEPFLLSSSLLGVVGQRLVRKLCPKCREGREFTPDQAVDLGFDPDTAPKHVFEANPEGCDACREGWIGRLPIHEVMLVSNDLIEAIADNAPQVEILRLSRAAGMTTMREDGYDKVRNGLTSIDEVVHSTRAELA